MHRWFGVRLRAPGRSRPQPGMCSTNSITPRYSTPRASAIPLYTERRRLRVNTRYRCSGSSDSGSGAAGGTTPFLHFRLHLFCLLLQSIVGYRGLRPGLTRFLSLASARGPVVFAVPSIMASTPYMNASPTGRTPSRIFRCSSCCS